MQFDSIIMILFECVQSPPRKFSFFICRRFSYAGFLLLSRSVGNLTSFWLIFPFFFARCVCNSCNYSICGQPLGHTKTANKKMGKNVRKICNFPRCPLISFDYPRNICAFIPRWILLYLMD